MISVLEAEVKRLRELLTERTEKLNACAAALQHYAHPRNYLVHAASQQGKCSVQNVLVDDFSKADNSVDTLVAGRRAREFFRRYDNTKE